MSTTTTRKRKTRRAPLAGIETERKAYEDAAKALHDVAARNRKLNEERDRDIARQQHIDDLLLPQARKALEAARESFVLGRVDSEQMREIRQGIQDLEDEREGLNSVIATRTRILHGTDDEVAPLKRAEERARRTYEDALGRAVVRKVLKPEAARGLVDSWIVSGGRVPFGEWVRDLIADVAGEPASHLVYGFSPERIDEAKARWA